MFDLSMLRLRAKAAWIKAKTILKEEAPVFIVGGLFGLYCLTISVATNVIVDRILNRLEK